MDEIRIEMDIFNKCGKIGRFERIRCFIDTIVFIINDCLLLAMQQQLPAVLGLLLFLCKLIKI